MLKILQQLAGDKLFYLALVAGAVFWWLNHLYEWSPSIDNQNWSFLLMSCLLYPVLEELTFRGALQGAMLQSVWGAVSRLGLTQANWLCSLLFALFHLYSQNFAWAAAVIVPSLLFGFFRDRYNSTLPSIILHCFYNTGFFLLR